MDANTVIGCCKSGYQKNKFKKLKKGELRILGKLDLHGDSRAVAREKLEIHIPLFQLDNKLIILISHGKGTGAVKEVCDEYLQYDPMVLAYHSAQPKHGGTGAVYVHLKNINKDDDAE